MALQVNNSTLRDAIARRAFPYPEDGKVHAFGLRLAVPWSEHPNDHVQLVGKQFNHYTSAIGLFGATFCMFLGSVDPGDDYTYDPSNPAGCAHLTDGCWAYQVGDHKGHTALVQAGPVTVRRDSNESGTIESGEPSDTGWFGINIHAGGTADTIDDWSAGCCIIHGGWEGTPWTTFIGRVEAAGQSSYSYYLLSGSDLEPPE